jgi:hypothetical protein
MDTFAFPTLPVTGAVYQSLDAQKA